MKVIILAAGYATRLYPITLDKPKALLMVAGKLLITHLIEKCNALSNIEHIYVISNNKFHQHLLDWSTKTQSEIPITILNDQTNTEEERLGALGDLQFAIEQGNIDDDLLILGSDNLFEDSLTEIHNLFNTKDTSVVAFKDIHDREQAKQLGIGALDEQNKITAFVEKPETPPSTLAATLIYFLRKQDIPEIKNLLNHRLAAEEVKTGEFIQHLITKTDVHGHTLQGKWFDIGTQDQLEEANEFFS